MQSICQMCGTRKQLHVHHIMPWHVSEELRYSFDNLITLCQPDHFRFGHWLDWKQYNPNIVELCERAQELNTSVEWDKYNIFHRGMEDEGVGYA